MGPAVRAVLRAPGRRRRPPHGRPRAAHPRSAHRRDCPRPLVGPPLALSSVGALPQDSLRPRLAPPRRARLVPSRATADEVIKLTRMSARRIDVVPLAPAADERAEFRTPPETALERHRLSADGYLLVLGTIEPRKNHVRVVQAFERLVRDNAIPTDMSSRSRVSRAGDRTTRWARFGRVRSRPGSSCWDTFPTQTSQRSSRVLPPSSTPRRTKGSASRSSRRWPKAPPSSPRTSRRCRRPPGTCGFPGGSLRRGLDRAGIHDAVGAGVDVRTAAIAQAARFSWTRTAEGTREAYAAALGT